MADDLSWVPPGVDTGQANVARVYDYWLGGSHNFLADQDAARANGDRSERAGDGQAFSATRLRQEATWSSAIPPMRAEPT